jgi:hypothetical protein
MEIYKGDNWDGYALNNIRAGRKEINWLGPG